MVGPFPIPFVPKYYTDTLRCFALEIKPCYHGRTLMPVQPRAIREPATRTPRDPYPAAVPDRLNETPRRKEAEMALPASDLTKKPDLRTTMELGAVLPETAEVRDDHLFIGGVDMVQLAREEGTALYVFDEADLRHRMEAYRKAFEA